MGDVVRFPAIKLRDWIKEEILATLDEHKDIDTGILLIQTGENISIFCSRYTVELIGALEVLKTKITNEILIEDDGDFD